ncbi:MAG: basic amino acid ABC transporter substrate-binding protein [Eubacteriales bacterium]|nr:basic amino acid ABC transporter substrate-binding protein [Eubacteriales bacterium]
MQKTIFRLLALVAVCAMAVMAFSACNNSNPSNENLTEVNSPAGDSSDGNVIVMGTNAEFPPFEYVGDDGEVDGFDVALVKEIGKKIGAEVKIENMEFKSLIFSLANGKVDLVAAGMTVTDERKKEVDFSETYFVAKQKIIVKEGSDIKTLEDLRGKAVGVQEGTTGDLSVSKEEYADDPDHFSHEVTVQRFKKGVDAVMDLVNGRVDAVVIDSNPAAEYVQNNEGLVALESGLEEEEYAIAVKKGNSELLEKINTALSELKEDGTYDKLVEKYLQ